MYNMILLSIEYLSAEYKLRTIIVGCFPHNDILSLITIVYYNQEKFLTTSYLGGSCNFVFKSTLLFDCENNMLIV